MAQIIKLKNKKQIKEIFENDNVVALPTDTVYGLACLYNSKKGFERLVKIKKRPSTKPFTLLFKNYKQINDFCSLSKKEKLFIKKFFPGKVTILLKLKKQVPYHVDLGTGIVGARIIKGEDFEFLMNALGSPILLTSCNISNEKNLESITEIQNVFGKKINYIFDMKIKIENKPTTIVKFEEDSVKIIREGSIPSRKILKFYTR